MSLPNRITLQDFLQMPMGDLVALSAEQLALLQEDIEENLRCARMARDWLDGVLVRKYGERAAALRREAGKDTGTVRLADGIVTVIAELPKKVEWDQAQLAALVERIRAGGEDASEYVIVEYRVSERAYGAWPESIRQAFAPARTVRTGKQTFKLSIDEGGL
ncbi:MAG TPA: hypothetical protein VNK48_07015 [Xanthobacteraceae bacterium]|nr:hypothetical protein [Xanthobacteraceae bacterium]